MAVFSDFGNSSPRSLRRPTRNMWTLTTTLAGLLMPPSAWLKITANGYGRNDKKN
jgi:hypothetical protein